MKIKLNSAQLELLGLKLAKIYDDSTSLDASVALSIHIYPLNPTNPTNINAPDPGGQKELTIRLVFVRMENNWKG